ncbi:MAG TPA: HAD family hydrolase [Thermodesulfovibrionia bacterium]|nr:HAD family hydrolase [Thermodesulfovibrionia bacterium]
MTVQKRLTQLDRLFITDIDNTLTGHSYSLRLLLERLEKAGSCVGFGVAAGRNLDLTLDVLQAWDVPMPEVHPYYL